MHKQTLELANKLASEIQTASENLEILKTALEKTTKSTCKYQVVSIKENSQSRSFECLIPNEGLSDILKQHIKTFEVIQKSKQDELDSL